MKPGLDWRAVRNGLLLTLALVLVVVLLVRYPLARWIAGGWLALGLLVGAVDLYRLRRK